MSTMDVDSFEAEIRADGYTDVSTGGFATCHVLARRYNRKPREWSAC